MIDLRKNDIIDTVFKRYKESYGLTENTPDCIPIKDIAFFETVLRRNLRKDIKRIDREFRKFKRREFRARVWAWIKRRFSWHKKTTDEAATPSIDTITPDAPDAQTPPQPDTKPAQSDALDTPDEAVIPDAPAETERDGTSETRRAERSELCATPRRDTETRTLSPRDPAPISPDTLLIQDSCPTPDELLKLDKCETDDELPETDEKEPDDECPII